MLLASPRATMLPTTIGSSLATPPHFTSICDLGAYTEPNTLSVVPAAGSTTVEIGDGGNTDDVFVSSQAQFTPKTVETKDEREKLMFRVKLQASREMLLSVEDRVKSGLRGVAYLRVDRAVEWPARLAVKLPQ